MAVTAALVLSACGGGDEAAPSPTVKTPKGFDLPEGVTLTEPGTKLAVGKPASVVLTAGDNAASAVTTTVDDVEKGKIADFKFFSLDAASKTATPYYVTATVKNEGPAGLGGLSAPLVAHDDSDTIYPPNAINGAFKPCPGGSLPQSFLPGKSAEVCLVFLVPKGRKLVTVDSVSGDPATAVRWKP